MAEVTIKTVFAQEHRSLGRIGRVGENLAREIVFDCAKVLEGNAGAQIVCAIKRPGDAQPYTRPMTADGAGRYTLTLTAADVAKAGSVQMELRMVDGEAVLKTAIYTGIVSESIGGVGDAPGDPTADALNRLEETIEAGSAATEAANTAAFEAAAIAEAASAAETDRTAAEKARASAEQERCNAENKRVSSEQERYNAENKRVSSEQERYNAENKRVSSEQKRYDAENKRVSSEQKRYDAERERVSAEEARASAEKERVSAETDRAAAEEARAAEFAGFAEQIEAATPDDTIIGARPWTSKKTVDALCMPLEENGSVVTCYPVEGYPLGIKTRIDAVQAGEGDPSPENIRPISGWDSVELSIEGDSHSDSYAVELTETVYGGTLDWETGVLTVTHGHISAYAGESLPGEWISDRDVYAAGTLPTTGSQVVYELATPYTIQLTPRQAPALAGENNIYANSGDVEVRGRTDPVYLTHTLMERIAALEAAAINA